MGLGGDYKQLRFAEGIFLKSCLYLNDPVDESMVESGTGWPVLGSLSPPAGLRFPSGEMVGGGGDMGPMPEGCCPAPMTAAFVSWGLRITQGRVAPFLASGVENASVFKRPRGGGDGCVCVCVLGWACPQTSPVDRASVLAQLGSCMESLPF